MALVWVTGVSGTGKSTVVAELVRRGHLAFDADEGGISAWRDRTTREVVPFPHGRWPDHAWMIEPSMVERLAQDAAADVGFLAGAVENEGEVWDLFGVVVCLVADEATLRARLARRGREQFGSSPHELDAVLGWAATIEASYRSHGATIVDATQPLVRVVDEILDAAGLVPLP